MYMPHITDAQHAATYLLGPYIAMLFTECESQGYIEYKHVLFVYAPPESPGQPPRRIYAVAAESNPQLREAGIEALFLGVFPGDGHHNMGASTDWADLETFSARALALAAEHFGIEADPVLLPPPDDDAN